jgi:tetratricopeptide (TPR) repeat protein
MRPGHAETLDQLATCLAELGHYPEAVAVLRALIDLHPERREAWVQLARLLATFEPGAVPDLDAALETLERAQHGLAEPDPALLLLAGHVELNRQNLAQARRLFSQAAEAGAPRGRYLMALALYLERSYGRAMRTLREMLRPLSEDDRHRLLPEEGRRGEAKLAARDEVVVEALALLYWSARRAGGYPQRVARRARVQPAALPGRERRFRLRPLPGSAGRGAFFDYDRDGDDDLIQAGPFGLRLLRNTGTRFADVTRPAGLAGLDGAWDVCLLDEDGDGWLDLYALRDGFIGAGRNTLHRNDHGRFLDVTRQRGLNGDRATARAIAVDLSGDGRPDILEVGHSTAVTGAVRLHVREGDTFVERARGLGLEYRDNAVDVVVGDFDGDGLADVFVLGWKAPGRLLRNVGGRFVDATEASGLDGVGGHGYSAVTLDHDGDGHLDLLVTQRATPPLSALRLLDPTVTSRRGAARLFRNDGTGRFEERTELVGLNRPFAVTQAVAADLDVDGFTDLVFAQGGLDRGRLETSLALRNEDGRRFTEWTHLPGPGEPHSALGVAVANGDGRPDVYLSGVGLLLQE